MKPILDRFPFYKVKWDWIVIKSCLHISKEGITKEDQEYPYLDLLKGYKKIGGKAIENYLNEYEIKMAEKLNNNTKKQAKRKNKRRQSASVVKTPHNNWINDDDDDYEKEKTDNIPIIKIEESESNNIILNDTYDKRKNTITKLFNCSFFKELPNDIKNESIELINVFNKGVNTINKLIDYCDKKSSSFIEKTLKNSDAKVKRKKNNKKKNN